MSRRPIVAFVALVLILLAQGPALADTYENTITLTAGDSWEIVIDNKAGEDLWIEYEVRVIEGPRINVWFTSARGYFQFLNASFTTFSHDPNHSVKETAYAEHSWAWGDEGVYYIIIDNTRNEHAGQNVTVEYTVTWDSYSLDPLVLFPIIIIAIVVIVVVIVLALLVAKREAAVRKAKRTSADTAKAPTATTKGPPEPPEPYPEWVVRSSMEGAGSIDDDDAEGWDPRRDE